MTQDRVERRLTAILAADVAGYSRLMGIDEEGTLAALKKVRREVVDLKIAEHRGRIVQTSGDGLLAEFASVVDAIRCALEMQREMARRNADGPKERRIEFRVGINLGESWSMNKGHLAIASTSRRARNLAEPGGSASAAWYDQVRDKLAVALPVETTGQEHRPAGARLSRPFAPAHAHPRPRQRPRRRGLCRQTVDRRPAVHNVTAVRAGYFRRRHHRGHHHGAVEMALVSSSPVRHRLPGKIRRSEAGSQRPWCSLCARGSVAKTGRRARYLKLLMREGESGPAQTAI
jgi:class 3 adenylate cyclase